MRNVSEYPHHRISFDKISCSSCRQPDYRLGMDSSFVAMGRIRIIEWVKGMQVYIYCVCIYSYIINELVRRCTCKQYQLATRVHDRRHFSINTLSKSVVYHSKKVILVKYIGVSYRNFVSVKFVFHFRPHLNVADPDPVRTRWFRIILFQTFSHFESIPIFPF